MGDKFGWVKVARNRAAKRGAKCPYLSGAKSKPYRGLKKKRRKSLSDRHLCHPTSAILFEELTASNGATHIQALCKECGRSLGFVSKRTAQSQRIPGEERGQRGVDVVISRTPSGEMKTGQQRHPAVNIPKDRPEP